MALTLTVLGCDGTYAGPNGACSGYLVRSDSTSVWVDTGPGTLAALQVHVPLVELDAIVVTHEHPDHCMELPVVRNALKYGFGAQGMRVITTRGVRRLMERITLGAAPTFVWEEVVDGDATTVGDLGLAFARTDHPVETLAVRVEHGGRVLVYSADTGRRFSFRPFGAPVHLALCEATVPAGDAGGVHMTGAEAGALAREAGAEHLLLTHLVPGTDPARRRSEAEATYEGPVSMAAPGDTYEV
jgi:ribonuclease BN (tRNA processing enzyme)